MRRHQLSSIVVAAGAGLTLAGCGANSGALGSVLAAARLTLAQSAEATVTLRGASVLPGASGSLLAHAVFAFPAGLGYEALELPGLGRRGPANAYLVFLPAQVDVEPAARSALPAGRLWIAASFGGQRAQDPRLHGLALLLESLNPALLLDALLAGADAASSLGERVIAHVPYTEYSVSIDLEHALAGRAAPVAAALRAALGEERAGARKAGAPAATVRAAVWVDGPGRLVQLRASLPGSGWGSILVVLSDFGVKVPRNLPIDSQVVSLASLAHGGRLVSAAMLFAGSP